MSRKNIKTSDTRLAQPDFTKLTPRQQRFIDAYVLDPSPRNAAIAAGYSAKSAYVAGHNLIKLEKIAGEISRRRMATMAATQAAQELNLELVIKELRRLAFSDIRRVIRWGMKGKKWARQVKVGEKAKEESVVVQACEMIPSWELDDDIAAAVQKVFIGADGRIRIELYDKIEPLQTLGRHLGLRGSAASIGRIGDNILNATGAPGEGRPLPPVDLSRLPMAKLKELDEWLSELRGPEDIEGEQVVGPIVGSDEVEEAKPLEDKDEPS